MSPITKEQLIEILQHRISVASGFPESENAQIDLELARLALESLELERGIIRRFDLDMSGCDSFGQDCGADMVEDLDGEYVLWAEVLPHLYRYGEYTPTPAPVSVPNVASGVIDPDDPEYSDGYRVGWNACRAAMLQSQGNCIEDGWISCSERMPKGYADVLVTDGEHVEVKWWDESGYWNSWTELNSDIFADEITHWMPLPEPPQEVNRG